MHISHNDNYVCVSRGSLYRVFSQTHLDYPKYSHKFPQTVSFIFCSNGFSLVGLFNGDLYIYSFENKHKMIYSLTDRVTNIVNYGCYFYVSSAEGEIVVLYICFDKKEQSTLNDYSQNMNSSFLSENKTSTLDNFDSSYLLDTKTSLFDQTDNLENISNILDNSENTLNDLSVTLVNKFNHPASIISISTDGNLIFVLDMRGKVTEYPSNLSYDISGSCMSFCRYLFISENNRLFCRTEEAFACLIEAEKNILSFVISKNGGVFVLKHKDKFVFYDCNFTIVQEFDVSYERYIFDENRLRIVGFDGFNFDVLDVSDLQNALSSSLNEVVFSKSKIVTRNVVNKVEEERVSKYIDLGNSKGLLNLGAKKMCFTAEAVNKSHDLVNKDQKCGYNREEIPIIDKTADSITETSSTLKNKGTPSFETKIQSGDDKSGQNLTKFLKIEKISNFASKSLNKTESFFQNECSPSNLQFKRKKKSKSRFIDDAAEEASSEKSSLEDSFEQEEVQIPHKYQSSENDSEENNENYFQNNNSYSPQSNNFSRITTQKPFMCGSFTTSDSQLFCYNTHGYITRLQTTIEAIYHDSETPLQSFNKTYKLGYIHRNFSVFADEEGIHFFGATQWSICLSNIVLLTANDYFIVAISTSFAKFYLHNSKLAATIAVMNPVTVCSSENEIVLYANDHLYILNKFLDSVCVYFKESIDFLGFSNNIVYFGKENKLFKLKKNLFFEVMDVKGKILCVNEKYLITTTGKIFPNINVEFYKIASGNEIIDQFLEEKINPFQDFISGYTKNSEDVNKVVHFRAKRKHDEENIYQDQKLISSGIENFNINQKSFLQVDSFVNHLQKPNKGTHRLSTEIADSNVNLNEDCLSEKVENLDIADYSENKEDNIQKEKIKTHRVNPFARKK